MSRTFRNPILPGCHPDPSICRAGDDYYLVNSSFEYFPGLPIFHSLDLVHWRPIGHVIDRTDQVCLEGVRPSGGLYAPTIRHRDGTFYVINTLVDGKGRSGNFIVRASDPAGPWSDPSWLEAAPGFDPSLFFDDDGRVWYTGCRMAAHSQYEGHTEIWLQELDLNIMCLVGEPVVLWDGAVKGAVWAEAPHIYKVDGRYYLFIAEGGTAHHHAVSVARSEKITGPYESNKGNPILTHRHLGQHYPIVGAGHGDLVQTQTGQWWMVLLGMRPYGGYFYNLGRETFLVPVTWEEGWPIVSPGSGRVEFEYPAPDLPDHAWPPAPDCDDFEEDVLDLQWNILRGAQEPFWSLNERPGFLRLKLQPQSLSESSTPSFIGRRQQHMNFETEAVIEFTPQTKHECAGLALVQNPDFHFQFVITRREETVIRLVKRSHGVDELLAEEPVPGGRTVLKVRGDRQAYSFFAAREMDRWHPIAENVDGSILSTPVAGGFVGAYLGLYASSNGQPSKNHADFDSSTYAGINEH